MYIQYQTSKIKSMILKVVFSKFCEMINGSVIFYSILSWIY